MPRETIRWNSRHTQCNCVKYANEDASRKIIDSIYEKIYTQRNRCTKEDNRMDCFL